MGLTLTDSGSGGDFTPVPQGTHIARCVRIIDLGMQPGSAQFPDPKPKVLIAWEIPDEIRTVDGEEYPALIMARYTASLHEKAGLRKLLESWRGRKFTKEELAGFSLQNVLDVPCMITVVHSDDGKYANVQSVAKLPKGFTAPERMSGLVWYELEHGKNAVYEGLSDKLRATIDVGAGRAPEPPPAPKPPRDDTQQRNGQVKAAAAAAAHTTQDADSYFEDAGVPF